MTDSLRDECLKHEAVIELYDRVHAELDEGRDWSEIDYGLRLKLAEPRLSL